MADGFAYVFQRDPLIGGTVRENMNYDLDREAGERELDEAASNLDATSEALIVDALNKLMKNRTTIMIAHNFAATKNIDKSPS